MTNVIPGSQPICITAPVEQPFVPGHLIISDLPAGSYTLAVTDTNGCTGSPSTGAIRVTASGPIKFCVDVCCNHHNKGKLTVSKVHGGTPPYRYSIGGEFQPIQEPFTKVDKGIYTVTVKDENGCTAHKEVRVCEDCHN